MILKLFVCKFEIVRLQIIIYSSYSYIILSVLCLVSRYIVYLFTYFSEIVLGHQSFGRVLIHAFTLPKIVIFF